MCTNLVPTYRHAIFHPPSLPPFPFTGQDLAHHWRLAGRWLHRCVRPPSLPPSLPHSDLTIM